MSDTPPLAREGPSGDTKRCNLERTNQGVRVCWGDHDKSLGCEWEYFLLAAPAPVGQPRTFGDTTGTYADTSGCYSAPAAEARELSESFEEACDATYRIRQYLEERLPMPQVQPAMELIYKVGRASQRHDAALLARGNGGAEARAKTPTNSLHNSLTRQARALCDLIEGLPAGEQQTQCSIAASDLLRAIYLQTQPDPVAGANLLLEQTGPTPTPGGEARTSSMLTEIGLQEMQQGVPMRAEWFCTDTVCDRCNNPKSRHNGFEKFCPFYSTFRERSAPAPASEDGAQRREVASTSTADDLRMQLKFALLRELDKTLEGNLDIDETLDVVMEVLTRPASVDDGPVSHDEALLALRRLEAAFAFRFATTGNFHQLRTDREKGERFLEDHGHDQLLIVARRLAQFKGINLSPAPAASPEGANPPDIEATFKALTDMVIACYGVPTRWYTEGKQLLVDLLASRAVAGGGETPDPIETLHARRFQVWIDDAETGKLFCAYGADREVTITVTPRSTPAAR